MPQYPRSIRKYGRTSLYGIHVGVGVGNNIHLRAIKFSILVILFTNPVIDKLYAHYITYDLADSNLHWQYYCFQVCWRFQIHFGQNYDLHSGVPALHTTASQATGGMQTSPYYAVWVVAIDSSPWHVILAQALFLQAE